MHKSVYLSHVYLYYYLYPSVSIWFLLLRIADAEENLGESEVREAHLAKSLFFIRIGDLVYKCYNALVLGYCFLLLHVF